MSKDCNTLGKFQAMVFVKTPPKSKSNPSGNTGENMGVFFKQKITPDHLIKAQNTAHLIIIKK